MLTKQHEPVKSMTGWVPQDDSLRAGKMLNDVNSATLRKKNNRCCDTFCAPAALEKEKVLLCDLSSYGPLKR